jgi:hypothetical protein
VCQKLKINTIDYNVNDIIIIYIKMLTLFVLILIIIGTSTEYTTSLMFPNSESLTQYIDNFVPNFFDVFIQSLATIDYSDTPIIENIMINISDNPTNTLKNVDYTLKNIYYNSDKIINHLYGTIYEVIENSDMLCIMRIRLVRIMKRIHNKCNNNNYCIFHNINTLAYHITANEAINNYFLKRQTYISPFMIDLLILSSKTELLFNDIIIQTFIQIDIAYKNYLIDPRLYTFNTKIIQQFMAQLLVIIKHNNIGVLINTTFDIIEKDTKLPSIINKMFDIVDRITVII